jgi:hypothetical protein
MCRGISILKGRTAISHSNRNFVLAYVFLVALPILGLLGILRSGRHLTAPFSVDGTWKIEAAANRVPAPTCSNFLSAVSNAPLSISQSGEQLVVGLNGGSKTAAGVLEGKTIRASFSAAENSGQADCAGQPWTLTATLNPQTEPKTLRGKLSVAGCASCVPLEFRAVRQPRTVSGGAH